MYISISRVIWYRAPHLGTLVHLQHIPTILSMNYLRDAIPQVVKYQETSIVGQHRATVACSRVVQVAESY